MRRRSCLTATVFALALVAPLLAPVAPAAAIPAPGNGCNLNGTPAAVMSWYPGGPGGVSRYQTSCVFKNDPPNSEISASYSMHDMRFAQYHNGSSRHIIVNSSGGLPTTTLQASVAFTGTGLSGWANRMIWGPGITPGTHVVSVNDASSQLTLNQPITTPGGVMIVENAPSARWLVNATLDNPTTLRSSTGTFTMQDFGHSITGDGIQPNTTITTPITANTVTLSLGAGSLGGTVEIGEKLNYLASGSPYGPAGLTITSTRSVTGVSLSAAATLTSSIATFQTTDIGLLVTASDPDGAGPLTAAADGCDDGLGFVPQYITAVGPGTTIATVSPGGMTPGRTCDLIIGEPNTSAPADGAVMFHKAMELDVTPTLVPGMDSCSLDRWENLEWVGTWYNPGTFQGSLNALVNRQPGYGTGTPPPGWPTSKAIGQIRIQTGVVDFSIFVMEREAATAAPNGMTGSYPAAVDPIGVRHYDYVVPFWPVALAMCPGSATSPGLTFSNNLSSITLDQVDAPATSRRPGTNQVRSIIHRPTATPGYNGTTYATSDVSAGGAQWTPVANFTKLCVYPPAPATVSFRCGAA